MPQISPMNWIMIMFFFIYVVLFMQKNNLNELMLPEKKMVKKINYVK